MSFLSVQALCPVDDRTHFKNESRRTGTKTRAVLSRARKYQRALWGCVLKMRPQANRAIPRPIQLRVSVPNPFAEQHERKAEPRTEAVLSGARKYQRALWGCVLKIGPQTNRAIPRPIQLRVSVPNPFAERHERKADPRTEAVLSRARKYQRAL